MRTYTKRKGHIKTWSRCAVIPQSFHSMRARQWRKSLPNFVLPSLRLCSCSLIQDFWKKKWIFTHFERNPSTTDQEDGRVQRRCGNMLLEGCKYFVGLCILFKARMSMSAEMLRAGLTSIGSLCAIRQHDFRKVCRWPHDSSCSHGTAIQFPLWRDLFFLKKWVNLVQCIVDFLNPIRGYAKVHKYFCRNRCRMYGCIM